MRELRKELSLPFFVSSGCGVLVGCAPNFVEYDEPCQIPDQKFLVKCSEPCGRLRRRLFLSMIAQTASRSPKNENRAKLPLECRFLRFQKMVTSHRRFSERCATFLDRCTCHLESLQISKCHKKIEILPNRTSNCAKQSLHSLKLFLCCKLVLLVKVSCRWNPVQG